MDNIRDNRRIRGFWDTFQLYPVTQEWAEELHNYFIMGYLSGSFHQACFANDLYGAACRTHISNRWENIVAMMKWINEYAPAGSWGSYENVATWLAKSEEERKKICINKGWMLTDEEYTWARVSEEA